MNQNDMLQTRLDQNYRDYVAQLQGKTADELIVLASEIVAAQQLRDELACACSEEDAAALLQFDDPLEEMRGFWATEQDGCHSGEIGHMIDELQCRGEFPALGPSPAEAVDKPAMRLSEKEHRFVVIAGLASNILHEAGRHTQAGLVFQQVMACQGYQEALSVVRAYMDLEIVPAAQVKNKSGERGSRHER